MWIGAWLSPGCSVFSRLWRGVTQQELHWGAGADPPAMRSSANLAHLPVQGEPHPAPLSGGILRDSSGMSPRIAETPVDELFP